MTIGRLSFLILLFIASSMIPAPLQAVATEEGRYLQKDIEENRKMDALSLAAYISVVVGIASLFIVPGASLLLMPVGLILGLVAILGRRNRYEKRRGRGLALAAIAIGGAFTLALATSFFVFILLGF